MTSNCCWKPNFSWDETWNMFLSSWRRWLQLYRVSLKKVNPSFRVHYSIIKNYYFLNGHIIMVFNVCITASFALNNVNVPYQVQIVPAESCVTLPSWLWCHMVSRENELSNDVYIFEKIILNYWVMYPKTWVSFFQGHPVQQQKWLHGVGGFNSLSNCSKLFPQTLLCMAIPNKISSHPSGNSIWIDKSDV